MRTTASISLVAALGLLSLSTATAAQAAPAKVGVKTTTGGVTVQIKNPNRYAVKGSVTLLNGKRKVASKKTSVKPRRSKTVGLSARGAKTVTVVTRLGRAGAKPKVTRRTVRVGSGAPRTPQPGGLGASSIGANPTSGTGAPSSPPGNANPGGGGSNPGGGGGTGTNPPPPAANPHFSASVTGTAEPFGFTLKSGVVDLDQTLEMPVTCRSGQTEVPGTETFDPTAGWALGDSEAKTETHVRKNGLSGATPRTVTYRLVTNQTADDTVSGSISQTYYVTQKVGAQTRYYTCSGIEEFTATRDQ